MELGNGRWESTVFNSRFQPTQIALGNTVGATDKLKLDYTYNTPSTADNNGNVKTQKITVARSGQSDLVFDQTYTYDSLNRLQIAEEKTGTTSNWKQTFTFDRYGNRRFDQSNTTFPASFSNANLTNPTFNASNNRMASGQSWTYDAAGNVIGDPDGRTFTYDAENKQTEVKNSSNASLGTYFFDGDGKRVKKVVPSTGETTIFVYDAGGKLVAEYSTNLSSTPQVQYLTNDNLGTPRIDTDRDGNITSRTDYMPYGEEIIAIGGRSNADNYAPDDVRQGFTGYVNDGETGLDYAQTRMYANRFGRFVSVDSIMLSSERIINPQTINLYCYGINNPLLYTDPDGLEINVTDNTQDKKGGDEYKTIVNSRKNAKFQVGFDTNNNLSIVDANGVALDKKQLNQLGKGLKHEEKAFFNAITDKANVAKVNLVRDDASIFVGKATGKGENTIDLGDIRTVLTNPNVSKELTQFSFVGHETLESYYSVTRNRGDTDAHVWTNQFFPGLGTTSQTGPQRTGDPVNLWFGLFPIAGRNDVVEQVVFKLVNPVPRSQYHPNVGGSNVIIVQMERQ